MKKEFFFIGHRGTLFEFDENTIQAFKKVIEFGATHIEFDVRRTLDNKLIVIHDKSINRTTNGRGLVNSLTYFKISQYNTKKKSSKVPLLKEVFDIFRNQTDFIVEIKEHGIINELLDIVRNFSIINSCIFSGRDLDELLLLKSISPSSKICYNITKGKPMDLKEFIALPSKELTLIKPDLINLKAKLITPEFIRKCHDNDIIALAWNFIDNKDPIRMMQKLITWGIDGILFDNFENLDVIKELI